jgi:spore coat protein U-like protein
MEHSMKTLFKALVAVSVLGAGSALAASPTTGSFTVTAAIQKNCTIVSSPTLDFGNVDPTLTTDIDVSVSLVNRCTKGTSFTIALDDGLTGAFTGRKMESAGANTDQLSYNLYTDAARTTVFGDGTGATSTASGTGAGMVGAGNDQTTVIYGRLTQGEDVSADNYSDTVAITITY